MRGSVTSKCTRGHRKAQQRCTSRCRRWYWILPAPPGPDGKRRRQWSQAYPTKTQAEEALTEELRRRDQGIILNQERITLREFSRRWLDHMATLGHDERALERYQELLELHVLPTIGGLQLKQVQPLHLSDLYVQLLQRGRRDGKPGGLKPRTVGHVHRAIHRMLKQAVRWRLIAINPASDLELPTVADEPMVTLTIEQARTLLEAARPRPWLHALILLGVATGARLGELLALQWSDIDLQQGTVRIGRSRRIVNRRMQVKGPKTQAATAASSSARPPSPSSNGSASARSASAWRCEASTTPARTWSSASPTAVPTGPTRPPPSSAPSSTPSACPRASTSTPCGTPRQGWDSNPWKPCDFNGFRDRPIRPLWHLAVGEYSERRGPAAGSALAATLAEKGTEQVGALLGEHAAVDLDPMGEAWVADEVPEGRDGAGLGVVGPVDEPRDPCLGESAGAHGARLEGHHHRAPIQPPAAELGGGGAYGDQFGVGRRVRGLFPAVAAAAQHRSVLVKDDASDRDVLMPEGGPGLLERQPHPRLVGSWVGGRPAQRRASWSAVIQTGLVAIPQRVALDVDACPIGWVGLRPGRAVEAATGRCPA
jgi:hypothetical protein